MRMTDRTQTHPSFAACSGCAGAAALAQDRAPRRMAIASRRTGSDAAMRLAVAGLALTASVSLALILDGAPAEVRAFYPWVLAAIILPTSAFASLPLVRGMSGLIRSALR